MKVLNSYDKRMDKGGWSCEWAALPPFLYSNVAEQEKIWCFRKNKRENGGI